MVNLYQFGDNIIIETFLWFSMSKNDSGLNNIPEELKEYIFYSHGSFSVRNNQNGIFITFGRFSSQDIACAATCLLIKHDWDMASVKDDPLSEFKDKFWIFKVMNNHLIFDSQYDTFERAVEYLEINSRCNDYHNDILSKKKRKSKYDDIDQDLLKEYREIPNIFPRDDVFVVKYVSTGEEYGVFNSIDEAIVAKQLLMKNNWNIPSSVEMEFYGSFYWVFKVEEGILIFIDKFESYEDALDCLNSNKINLNNSDDKEELFGGVIRKIDDDYIEDIKNDSYVIENNFKKSISNDSILNTRMVVSSSHRHGGYGKTRKIREKIEVWSKDSPSDNEALKTEFIKATLKIKEMEEYSNEDILGIFKNLESKLDIVYFQNNTLKDYYSVTLLPDGEFDFTIDLYGFIEFKYIWKILSHYYGDLNKINRSSSIHYFNDCYYIIKVFDKKLIISGQFASYSEAEENIGFLYDYYSKSAADEVYHHNIKHYGNVFKLSEEHHGKTFEMDGFKSLEELKAVIDIFDWYDWNPDVFKNYDIFHYHGMYWIIDYFFYYIKLAGRFYSKDDAIEYKCR